MTVDQTIKQRLVGAIVLVAVAVIFLPGILGKKTERKTFTSKITVSNIDAGNSSQSNESVTAINESTAESEVDAAVTVASASASPEQENNTQVKANDSAAASQTEKSLTTNKKTVENSALSAVDKTVEASRVAKNSTAAAKKNASFKQPSWLIQVGSFSSNANARSLAKKLEDRKMKAFVRPVNLKQGEVLYRVFVGPWFEKRQAESKLAQVTEITRLKPIVVAWQPNIH